MQLHSAFSAIKKSASGIARQLNEPNYRDGAYARVGGLRESQVLKATMCDATNALFARLLTFAKKGLPIPEALPAIFRSHGKLVRDDDKLEYNVWTVERLFRPDEVVQMRRSRISLLSFYDKVKPGYLQPSTRLPAGELTELTAALENEQRSCTAPNSWEGSAHIALAMSLKTEGELRKAFRFLFEFVDDEQVQLDLLTQGNVMLNMFGRPCLSDPVCPIDPDGPVSQIEESICLAAVVPTKVKGLDGVTIEAVSTLPMGEAKRLNVKAELQKLGITSQDIIWGSAAHRKFLAQPLLLKQVWDYPDVAKNLRAGNYKGLISA